MTTDDNSNQDIRWQQRFSHFGQALSQLQLFVDKDELSILEKQGLIKAFEYTFELAWNLLRDYLRWQGHTDLIGSRDTLRTAFANGLIEDGEAWMDMVRNRNLTSHTYNQDTAQTIANLIVNSYYPQYRQLAEDFARRL